MFGWRGILITGLFVIVLSLVLTTLTRAIIAISPYPLNVLLSYLLGAGLPLLVGWTLIPIWPAARCHSKCLTAFRRGHYPEALGLAQKGCQIWQRAVGAPHPFLATMMESYAAMHREMKQYPEAERLEQKALAIRRVTQGDHHPHIGHTLNGLALVHYEQAQYDKAEPLYRLALKLWRVTPADHDVASVAPFRFPTTPVQSTPALSLRCRLLRCLCWFLYRLSEVHLWFLRNQLQAREAGICLNNLAQLRNRVGDQKSANLLYEQAQGLLGTLVSDTDLLQAELASNRSAQAFTQQNWTLAEELARQALVVFEKYLGRDHPGTARAIHNLAFAEAAQGKPEAEAGFAEAIRIYRATSSTAHPNLGKMLRCQAFRLWERGEYKQAKQLCEEALDLFQSTVGEAHPETALCFNYLARIQTALGQPGNALLSLKKAIGIEDQLIGQVFTFSSENQRAQFLDQLQDSHEALMGLISGHLSDRTDALEAGLNVVLRRKAIRAEALMVQREAVRQTNDFGLHADFEALRELRDNISKKVLNGPAQAESLQEYHQQINQWNRERERLERRLAQQLPAMNVGERFGKVHPRAVANRISAGAALLELVRYRETDFTAQPAQGESYFGEDRYLGFLLKPGDPPLVSFVDLGSAAQIDQMIQEYRRELTGEQDERQTYRGIQMNTLLTSPPPESAQPGSVSSLSSGPSGEQLRRKVFDVLESGLAGVTRLLISPDGDFARLPWECLPCRNGYLIDYYQVGYVSSGRDLLRPCDKTGNRARRALIVANPDFDYVGSHSGQPGPTTPEQARGLKQELPGRVEPLPGTRWEGMHVAEILGEVPMMDHQALDCEVKDLLHRGSEHGIVYVASHGFVLPDHRPLPGVKHQNQLDTLTSVEPLELEMQNPLLRSGLILSGYNSWRQGKAVDPAIEDGLLMADDVCNLDLSRVELVVLSACQTGLGRVQVGEGVLGLRRSFVLAGARTLVMSLWQVNDVSTMLLMGKFFDNLFERRLGRGEALREAQLYVRRLTVGQLKRQFQTGKLQHLAEEISYWSSFPDHHVPFSAPSYWGAFICQGDQEPLCST